jgi:hypothetical protein
VPSFIKEHQSANLSLKTCFFAWKIVRTPLPVVDKDNHLSKPNFYLSILQMKSSSTCLLTTSLCEGPFFYFYAESPPSTFMHRLRECGDPGLPIRNTRYAYNSRSHDQCVVNPHIRVNNRITSSFTISNNILTIGHMTKHDIATQGKSITKQRIPSSVDEPSHAYYPIGN